MDGGRRTAENSNVTEHRRDQPHASHDTEIIFSPGEVCAFARTGSRVGFEVNGVSSAEACMKSAGSRETPVCDVPCVFSAQHVTHHVSSTCDHDPAPFCRPLAHKCICQEKRVNKMTRAELARFASYKCECQTGITLLQGANYAAFPSEINQFSVLHEEYVLNLSVHWR